MNRAYLAALALLAILVATLAPGCAGCQYPTPGGVGGAPAAGGNASTGGAPVAGTAGATPAPAGGATTGGQAATGGATAIAWPECHPEGARQAPAKRHALGRKRGAMTKRIRAQYVELDLPDVFWEPSLPAPPGEHYFPPLKQGNIGKCTCEATLGMLLTKPHRWGGTTDRDALELLSDDLYRWATRHDPFTTPAPGWWEPVDTGSNGESALNAAVNAGLLKSYTSIGSFEELQGALQKGPCIVGIDWPEGYFSPDRCGAVKKRGAIAGGHEIVVVGHRRATKQTLLRNSWDKDWGLDGYFWMTDGDLSSSLASGGDAHCAAVPANDNAIAYREAG